MSNLTTSAIESHSLISSKMTQNLPKMGTLAQFQKFYWHSSSHIEIPLCFRAGGSPIQFYKISYIKSSPLNVGLFSCIMHLYMSVHSMWFSVVEWTNVE